jgi:predicted MFS family arabinose efflux permease
MATRMDLDRVGSRAATQGAGSRRDAGSTGDAGSRREAESTGDAGSRRDAGGTGEAGGGSARMRGLTLVFLGSIIVSFLAASAAPTPLYAVYAAHWGFSPLATTVVFGVYALAVLAGLLTFGKLSDHVGRRPVLLTGLALQAVAMVLFTIAGGLGMLLIARVVQGLAAGSSLGAIGAGMLDLDRRRGALANSFAPGVGTGTGALISALAVQFLPAPTHLIYLVLLGVFGLQAVGVLVMRETAPRRPGALKSLVPDIRLPRAIRSEVAIAAPVLFAVWALAGFYGSLGPALAATLLHSSSVVYGGLSFFILAGVAAVAVLAFNRTEARLTLYISIAALVAGVAVTLAATSTDSAPGFFIGTAIAGVGFGGGFQGGLRLVVPLAGEQERAGILSLLYIISYLGLGVPAVIAGVLVTEVNGLLATAQEYGVAVVVLAALALAGLLAHRPMKAVAGVTMAPEGCASGAGSAGSGPWQVEGPVQ